MMVEKKRDYGEFILLAVMLGFVCLFLYDIRTMPLEGKFLSYLLAPFIGITAFFCFRDAWRQKVKEQDVTKQRWSFYLTIFMGFFLFFSIYLLGFYLGSGISLLLWFIIFRKINKITLGITVGLPFFLYLSFEVLLDMGLPSGVFWEWVR